MSCNEKVAFVLHPDLDLVIRNAKAVKPGKEIREELILKMFEWLPPFKHMDCDSLSLDGEHSVPGAFYIVPFLPEMETVKKDDIVKKIDQGLGLAKSQGCTVAAMAGFTSIMIQGLEKDLAKKHDIRITSGNTLTSAIVIHSVEEIAEKCAVDFQDATVAIIGASGDIGSGCFLYFAERAGKMILTARGLAPLNEFVNKYRGFFDCEIEVTDDNRYAADRADIIILATSSYTTIFDLQDFRPRKIVCDASVPPNVQADPAALRDDIFVYHGGIAVLPFHLNHGLNIGLAKGNHLHGCQTEGLLNALHPDLPCSIGRGNITARRISKFLRLMEKYPSLGVAFSIGNKEYTPEEIEAYAQRWRKG
ncbi:MAG: hypothetical protein GF401_00030 [Chitinivibrionales bacterium]|nr:hypothetical protein [Chitinivibrionales bacterium]